MALGNLLLTFWALLIFALFATVFWLLPGLALIPRQTKLPAFDRIVLGTVVGFAVFAFTLFVTRVFGLPIFVAFLPFVFLAVKQRSGLLRTGIAVRKVGYPKIVWLGIAVIGMILQGMVLFRSGIRTEDGLRFPEISYHDSIWHIYIIEELKTNFPPRHGGSAPALIKNYHFLSDLVIASIGKYLPVSTIEIYYRVYPMFVSLLLSASVFVFARKLSGSEAAANAAVFLALFSGNAAWFVHFFRGPEFRPSANSFMLDPILDLMQNPHAVVVFPLMLAAIYGLLMAHGSYRLRWVALASIPMGVMIGFKAWGGLLMLGGMTVAALWSSLVKKVHSFWLGWLTAVALALIVFLPVFDAKSAAGMVFTPGWLLKRMVEDPDRYNMVQFFFLEQHYREKGNLARLIQINLTEFFIYLFGNLWIRVIGLFTAAVWLIKTKSAAAIFTVSVIAASLTLPVLFNQGRMSYDIIQFGPYGLLLLSIFTGITLVQGTRHLGKTRSFFVITGLLLLSVPSNIGTVTNRTFGKTFVISNAKLDAYRYIREHTDPESILLLYPSQHNIANAEVAAFTLRPTFFSGRTYARVTGENYEEREELLNDFFRSNADPQARNKLIQNYSIDYILLPKEEEPNFVTTGLSIVQSYSNQAFTVYAVH